jgi:thymidylate synthase (FAD)
MKIIKANYVIEEFYPHNMLKNIERAGKTCYKSENTITDDVSSAEAFVKMIIKNGHESVLEHEKITVRIICDRGVSHEICRHRIASYSQESTRYCNYGKGDVQYIDIRPHFKNINKDESWCGDAEMLWSQVLILAEQNYKEMIKMGMPPQLARSVLPNSLKTEIVITANLREWRHIFRLRTPKTAHPQMREIMVPLFKDLKERLPAVFDDIKLEEIS